MRERERETEREREERDHRNKIEGHPVGGWRLRIIFF